jgi:hypothetical protein
LPATSAANGLRAAREDAVGKRILGLARVFLGIFQVCPIINCLLDYYWI